MRDFFRNDEQMNGYMETALAFLILGASSLDEYYGFEREGDHMDIEKVMEDYEQEKDSIVKIQKEHVLSLNSLIIMVEDNLPQKYIADMKRKEQIAYIEELNGYMIDEEMMQDVKEKLTSMNIEDVLIAREIMYNWHLREILIAIVNEGITKEELTPLEELMLYLQLAFEVIAAILNVIKNEKVVVKDMEKYELYLKIISAIKFDILNTEKIDEEEFKQMITESFLNKISNEFGFREYIEEILTLGM